MGQATKKKGISPPPREVNGRYQRDAKPETDAEIVRSVVLFRRKHHGAKAFTYIDDNNQRKSVDETDARWGHNLGKLLLSRLADPAFEGITQRQYDAGVLWAETRCRWLRQEGFGTGNLKSTLIIGNTGGKSTAPEPDDETAAKVRRQNADMDRAVRDYTKAQGIELLKRVILNDLPLNGPYELGTLRMALNAVAMLKERNR